MQEFAKQLLSGESIIIERYIASIIEDCLRIMNIFHSPLHDLNSFAHATYRIYLPGRPGGFVIHSSTTMSTLGVLFTAATCAIGRVHFDKQKG